jgi:hypothetical protein
MDKAGQRHCRGARNAIKLASAVGPVALVGSVRSGISVLFSLRGKYHIGGHLYVLPRRQRAEAISTRLGPSTRVVVLHTNLFVPVSSPTLTRTRLDGSKLY